MRREFLIGAATAALAAGSLFAVTPAYALPAGFKAQADALLAQSYPATGPGAQVVITDHGRIVYRGMRGFADIAARRPVTASTVFRMGSITKQFASAVVLQLAAEGRLKLSDPIAIYLPSYPNGAAITVQQLLNHTSGIQSYTGIPGWMTPANTAKSYSTDQLVAVFKDLPAVTSPGAAWSYNNSGYVLVGALIEAVTHHPWYQEVDRRIVKPLGLTTIRYGGDEATVALMARGYSDEEGKIAPAQAIDMSVPAAAGALIGTTADLARWADALHHGRVVTAPYYARMIAPTVLPDGKTVPYGFGLEPGMLRGEPVVGHSGGIFGFSTDSIYLPRHDLFVTVFTNSDSPKVQTGVVMNRLAALAIGRPFDRFVERPIDIAAVTPALGRYQFDGFERIVTIDGGKLFAQRVGGPRRPVFATGGNRYFYDADDLAWFSLGTDAAGKRIMGFHPDGADAAETGTYAGPPPVAAAVFAVPAALLASYAGSYTAPIGKVMIAQSKSGLTIQLARQPAFALRPSSPTEFHVDEVGALVSFVSAGGEVSGLELEQGGQKLSATRD